MIKRSFFTVGVVALLTVMVAFPAWAVPGLINYQGKLTDSGGNALNGMFSMTFRLYNASSGGSSLWNEIQSVQVIDGIYSVELGSVSPFSSTLFDSAALYLEVIIGSETLSPRQRLTSTAFSIKAALADSVVDGAVTTVMIADSAVDTQKVADSAITSGKVASNAITSEKIADGAVTAADIDDGPGSGLDADTLDGLDSTAFGDITAVIGGTGLSGGGTSGTVTLDVDIPLSLTGFTGGGVISALNNQFEGIALHGSAGGVVGRGVYGEATGTSATNYGGYFSAAGSTGRGVYGEATGTSGTGVYGTATGTSGTGVYGYNVNSGNYGYFGSTNYGVYGSSNSGYGVHGSGNGFSAVYGLHDSTGNEGHLGSVNGGVYGKHYSTGNAGLLGTRYNGVYGNSDSKAGVEGYHISSRNYGELGTSSVGVHGKHYSSGNYGYLGTSSYGVYGLSSSGRGVYGRSSSYVGVYGYSEYVYGVYGTSSTGYAGYFAGPVVVTGYLTKSGGGFQIDHPLDPENKYLNHSFVESPDMMNIYNGNVILDANGERWVELPEWFEALNKDFRYQLTCIGGFAQVYIAQEISDNRFKIAGGNSGMKVSWQVTGIRQDPWAEANLKPVEEDKAADELGFYLHPESYGQPEEKGIEWARNPEMMQQMKEEKEKSVESQEPSEG